MAKILRAKEMNKCLGCFTCMQICAAVNQKSHALSKAGLRVRTVGGMATSYIVVCCHGCKNPSCLKACPADALVLREGGGVKVKLDKCIGCRACETACGAKAVNFDTDTGKPIICNHCGACAKYCPHNCIQLVNGDE